MNIWLIQTGEPLPLKSGVRKMRTALLADKLLERGHEVFWWASAFEHQQKILISDWDRTFPVSGRFKIRVLRGWRYRKNISLARYMDHLIVALKFRIQSKNVPKPDMIIASMPCHSLAYEVVRYARKNGIPVLVDIRDLWPDIFLDRFRNMGLYALGRIVLALDFARLRLLLKNADGLTAVSSGYLKWGLERIRRAQSPFDGVFYHGYKPYLKKPKKVTGRLEIPDWIKHTKNRKVFVFIGTFGISYELELVLDAAQHFRKSGRTDICFVLAGAGEKFELLSKRASSAENVVLPGWIEKKEIAVLLKVAYVGLVPCRSIENTMPNKPFEYLSAGLPIINSLEGVMAELVERHQFGLNYLPGDLNGLCQCIESLAADSALHDKMSQNAAEFFKKHGDADKIYNEYCDHVERLVEWKNSLKNQAGVYDGS